MWLPPNSLVMLTHVRLIGAPSDWLKDEEVKAQVHLNLRRWESSLNAAPTEAACVSPIPESRSLSQPPRKIYESWRVM